jgi:hypothetical protein
VGGGVTFTVCAVVGTTLGRGRSKRGLAAVRVYAAAVWTPLLCRLPLSGAAATWPGSTCSSAFGVKLDDEFGAVVVFTRGV